MRYTFLKYTLWSVLFLLGLPKISAQTITYSGYVVEAQTEEAIIAANVFNLETSQGTTTNEYGFFSITLNEEVTPTFIISYVGYQQDTLSFEQKAVKPLKSFLQISSLSTVEVTGKYNVPIQDKLEVGQINFNIEEIKKLPAFMGETDVLKAIQLMPGVQSGNEGLSGLYVRGGGPDQNLVILDDVPIYNTGHALGIFSVFNADAIKSVKLIKGGFPARYGGRLSSVLDIRMKEGNLNKFQGKAGISLISANATIEGPLQKGKTSYLLSMRRSYPDLLVSPLLGFEKFKSFFSDFNLKLQHKINDKNTLFVSNYLGRDVFEIEEKEENGNIYGNSTNWLNLISSLRWNYNISPKLFANTSLSYSRYNFELGGKYKTPITDLRSAYNSGINDIRLKTNIDYVPNSQHYMKFGGEIIHHTYSPGALVYQGLDANVEVDTSVNATQLSALEANVYIEDTWTLSKRILLNYGVHFSSFSVEGKTYYSPQPRLSMNIKVTPLTSIKASYANMTQYINLLASEALSLPTDLWVPSTERIVPQQSWQTTLGIATTYRDKYQISVEGFYKKMDNVLSYKEGANFLLDFEQDWQDKITQGTGEAYGVEFLLRKEYGKLTGWVGYTLSKNQRQFADINGGKKFPFRFDRRHDASIVAIYQVKKNISISANWVYGTGNAVTIATQKFAISPDYVREFLEDLQPNTGERLLIDKKNNFRLSAYHRLDLGISFFKAKKRFDRTLTLNIYNFYNHVNPYYVRVDEKSNINPNTGQGTLQLVLQEVGVLPFLPSIAYKIDF